jgi:hypothetical protein
MSRRVAAQNEQTTDALAGGFDLTANCPVFVKSLTDDDFEGIAQASPLRT